MGQPSFEKLEIYQLAERLADGVWSSVLTWTMFARDTLGKQLVRAADSIGLNLAEGYGRGSYAENKRHVNIARGSLHETICGLQRASRRGLLTPDQFQRLIAITDELGPRMAGFLKYLIRQLQNNAPPGQPPASKPCQQPAE